MSQTADLLAATIAFNTNLRELTQKTTSLLENTLDNITMDTNFEYFDRIGSVELLVRQGRHSDVQYTPTEFSRRSITCVDFEGMDFIDMQDLQRQMVNTQSAQLANFVKAANRKKDEIIINSLLGSSKSVDKNGTLTDVPFDTANQLIADGSKDLTTKKLKDAIKIFEDNDVDLATEEVYCVLSTASYRYLLGQTEFINKDYKLGVNAEMKYTKAEEFYGIKFLRFNPSYLPVGAAENTKRAFLYVKKAGLFGKHKEITTIAEKNVSKQNIQLSASASYGAARMEEKLVVAIDCLTTDLPIS
jgi:hypothetical protein